MILLVTWNWPTLRKVSLELVNLRGPGVIVKPCISFSSFRAAGRGRTADLKTVGDYEPETVIFPQYAAKYAIPGLQA